MSSTLSSAWLRGRGGSIVRDAAVVFKRDAEGPGRGRAQRGQGGVWLARGEAVEGAGDRGGGGAFGALRASGVRRATVP